MQTLSISKARANLFKLVEHVSLSHQSVHIHGRHNKAVLISEEDFDSIQETLYLMSVPGMYEKLKEGLKTPLEECTPDSELEW